MLKRLMLLMLACALSWSGVEATDLSVLYVDAIGGDTDQVRVDVIYTDSMDTREFKRIWLNIQFEAVSKDSAGVNYVPYDDSTFANDSFFVFYQYSADGINWFTSADDTIAKIKKGDADTTINVAISLNRDSLNLGNYGRIKFVHRNTLSGEYELGANVYRTILRVFFVTVKP